MIKSGRRKRWSWSTRLRLVLAGWRPNRDVWERLTLPAGLAPFAAARAVLREFGGLRLGSDNEHMWLDPALGEKVADQVREFCSLCFLRFEHSRRAWHALRAARPGPPLAWGVLMGDPALSSWRARRLGVRNPKLGRRATRCIRGVHGTPYALRGLAPHWRGGF